MVGNTQRHRRSPAIPLRPSPLGRVHFFKDAHRLAQKDFAMRSQFSRFMRLNKRSLNLVLGFWICWLRGARLGDVALLGGAGEIARARHGHDVAKLLYFHRQCLS